MLERKTKNIGRENEAEIQFLAVVVVFEKKRTALGKAN